MRRTRGGLIYLCIEIYIDMIQGAVLLVIGGGMVLAALSWAIWRKRQGASLT